MRKHSAHRRREAVDPLHFLAPMRRTARDKLMATLHAALEQVVKGSTAGTEEWRDLSDAINVVESLIDLGKLTQDARPIVEEAVGSMVRAAKRIKEGRQMRFDAQGLDAIRQVLVMYEQCACLLIAAEFEKAIKETIRRRNAIVSGKPAGVQVVSV